MANFGALTDHFSEISTGWTLKNSSNPTTPKSRADATDANGDVCDAVWFGSTTLKDVSCDYELQSGTVNTNTLKLGEIDAVEGTIVNGINLGTSNSGVPTMSISGRTGCEAVVAPTGFLNTFTLPSISLTGAFQAQALGFTYAAGEITDTSLSFTSNIAETTTGLGVQAAHGVSGATGALSANWIRCPDEDPTWTLTLAGLTETLAPESNSEPDAAHHTGTSAAEIVVSRDVDAS